MIFFRNSATFLAIALSCATRSAFADTTSSTPASSWRRDYILPRQIGACAGLTGAFICGGDCEPWGVNQGQVYMNPTFGFGIANWVQFTTFIDVENGITFPTQADLAGYDLIYAEGGDVTWPALQEWLNTGGRTTLENLASCGGTKVFINAAPNDGTTDALLYGTTLEAFTFVNEATVLSPDLLNGPFQPTAVDIIGNFYAHAIITGGTTTTLIEGPPDTDPGGVPVPVLVQLDGYAVIEGGITNAEFHDPSTESFNVRANILDYLCGLVVPPTTCPPTEQPTLEPTAAPTLEPTAAPTKPKCPPCKGKEDDTSLVTVYGNIFGFCKEKCTAKDSIPDGFECGFCDE